MHNLQFRILLLSAIMFQIPYVLLWGEPYSYIHGFVHILHVVSLWKDNLEPISMNFYYVTIMYIFTMIELCWLLT